jgi:hypothetical protein
MRFVGSRGRRRGSVVLVVLVLVVPRSDGHDRWAATELPDHDQHRPGLHDHDDVADHDHHDDDHDDHHHDNDHDDHYHDDHDHHHDNDVAADHDVVRRGRPPR